MKKPDIEYLNSKLNNQLKQDYFLNKNSWFGIGGKSAYFFSPNNKKDLKFFLKNFNLKKFVTIGSGSNILFRDRGFDGVVIKLGKDFSKIEEINSKIIAGAASLKLKVAEFAQKRGFSNFEFLSVIPGTLGGGVFMNAGCFGNEMSDLIKEIFVMDLAGEEISIDRKDINFTYRESSLNEKYIITDIVFKETEKIDPDLIKNKIDLLKKQKRINQPSNIKTGGSTFKNPIKHNEKAWQLIKKFGCDKLFFGNAKFSQHHCNFIDNTGLASSDEIEKLIKETQNIVLAKSGIKLELEIKII